MSTVTTIEETSILASNPAVSWGAVIAGAIASLAITVLLIAFGTGVGFSMVSPWSDQGVSATTFQISTGIYLIVVAMISSAIGGMLAGRLRSRWIGLHNDEIYFRDTAHGFLAWGLALVLMVAGFGAASTHLLAGASAGLIPAAGASAGAAAASNPSAIYVDALLRTDPARAGTSAPVQLGDNAPAAAAAGNRNAASRAEIGRILAADMRRGGTVSADDKAYLAKVVAARTGLSQADAEKRVNQVITDAKKAADDTRAFIAKLAFWFAAAMLAGALSASLAATEGGVFRDTRWYEPGWRKANARSQYTYNS